MRVDLMVQRQRQTYCWVCWQQHRSDGVTGDGLPVGPRTLMMVLL
jgi:hypothetical protein